VVLGSGEIAAAGRRRYARHRTITDPERLRLLHAGCRAPTEPEVEQRPLQRYDALIPAWVPWPSSLISFATERHSAGRIPVR